MITNEMVWSRAAFNSFKYGFGCCFLSWVLGVGYSKSRSFHIIIRILLLVLFSFFINLFFELISSRRGDLSCVDIFRWSGSNVTGHLFSTTRNGVSHRCRSYCWSYCSNVNISTWNKKDLFRYSTLKHFDAITGDLFLLFREKKIDFKFEFLQMFVYIWLCTYLWGPFSECTKIYCKVKANKVRCNFAVYVSNM